MLDPSSSLAKPITDLFWLTLVVGGVIFALVTGLALYLSFRYRASPNNPSARQVFGDVRLELAWTIIPLILVLTLLVITAFTMSAADPISSSQTRTASASGGASPTVATGGAGQATPTADIVMTGSQWWWSVVYPRFGITTANEIYIPVGKDFVVKLGTKDVIHDPWVVRLGRKMDMNPGYTGYLVWRADEPGVYPGFCAEFCGTEHAWMLFRVNAVPQAEFDAWVSRQILPPPPSPNTVQARGQQVFLNRTCINCHTISGTSAMGTAGPDLSHVGSRWSLGAGVVLNTPENMGRWIRDPHEFKPGVLMPGIRITEHVYLPEVQMTQDNLNALVAYLESLK